MVTRKEFAAIVAVILVAVVFAQWVVADGNGATTTTWRSGDEARYAAWCKTEAAALEVALFITAHPGAPPNSVRVEGCGRVQSTIQFVSARLTRLVQTGFKFFDGQEMSVWEAEDVWAMMAVGVPVRIAPDVVYILLPDVGGPHARDKSA